MADQLWFMTRIQEEEEVTQTLMYWTYDWQLAGVISSYGTAAQQPWTFCLHVPNASEIAAIWLYRNMCHLIINYPDASTIYM